MDLDQGDLAQRSGRAGVRRSEQPEVKLSTGAELPFPGGSANAPLQPESILPVDFNYDFKTDLVFAGEGGVRFLRQESPTSFTDVTAQTKLPPALLNSRLHRRLGHRYRSRR